MVTGVDLEAGVDPPADTQKNRIMFGKAEGLFNEADHWYTTWVVLVPQHLPNET